MTDKEIRKRAALADRLMQAGDGFAAAAICEQVANNPEVTDRQYALFEREYGKLMDRRIRVAA